MDNRSAFYSPRSTVARVARRLCSARVLAVAMGLVLMVNARPASAATTITVDAATQTTGNPRFWSAAVGTGTASLTLRADLQTHYKIANRELGMQRVRGHGVLNDDMGIYKGAGSYDWTKFDTYLTAITSAGMRPIMELDFMPTALGTNSDSRSPPTDYSAWKDFIKAVAQHCVDEYGADDVGQWYWEVWNEPDYSGFWKNTDMAAYYTLYDNTVDALTSVLPNVLVGGPATTEPSKIGAFLQHCKSANKRVTFASSHNYPGGDGTKTSSASADAAGLVNDNNTRVSQISSGGYDASTVRSLNTEWNSSYSGQGGNPADVVVSMDNHWNVGFVLKAVKLLSDKNSGNTPVLDVFAYWAVSDVFDEYSSSSGSYMISKGGTLPFGQVFGMMTFQGMRKAAFNAFKMLNHLGPKRLQSGGGTASDGVDAMATKSDAEDEIQILVYNYYRTVNTTGSDDVTITVNNLPSALAGKEISVTQFLVDETHSNPYSVWVGQNKPTNPSEAQWQEMRKAQHLALLQPVSKKTVDTSFTTTFTLNRQAGTLIILGLSRPVTGRNALVEIEGEDYDGQSGATKENSNDTSLGQSVAGTKGSYVFFENVDFSDAGVGAVQLRVAAQSDATLELHADAQDAAPLGTCAVSSTAGAWVTQTCTLTQTTGVHRLFALFGDSMRLNWMKFQPGGGVPGTGGASGSGGITGSGGAGGGSASTTSVAGGSGAGGSTVMPGTSGTGGDSSGGPDSNASGGSGDGNIGGASSGSNSGAGGSSSTTGGGKSSGCSCRIGNARGSSGMLLIIGLMVSVFGLRRQRARQTTSG